MESMIHEVMNAPIPGHVDAPPKPAPEPKMQLCDSKPMPAHLERELAAHKRRDPFFDPRRDASQMSKELRKWFARNHESSRNDLWLTNHQSAISEQRQRNLHGGYEGNQDPRRRFGMGLTAGDFNNDGCPDPYITGYNRSVLYGSSSIATGTASSI
jgi:hypothetical protein